MSHRWEEQEELTYADDTEEREDLQTFDLADSSNDDHPLTAAFFLTVAAQVEAVNEVIALKVGGPDLDEIRRANAAFDFKAHSTPKR